MSQVTSQNALVKDSTVQTLNGKLDNLNATLGGNANIAPVFNTATAYSKGDMVNYNGDLYVFTANHSAGAWTGSDVVQTKVSSELSSLKSGLTIEESGDGNLLHIYKMSKMVAISGSVTLPYVVPEAYRPKSTAFAPCRYNNTLNYVAIYANGTVAVGDDAYTTGSVIFSAAYATA